ncbi:hypothetical protein JTB14_028197 [Gonioctena quinquepunctata]|nr:hypothetical protein JTB14_028197 [Gonioctena quinquepunctata]
MLSSEHLPDIETGSHKEQKCGEFKLRRSPLIFTEVDSDDADILIYFYRGDHRDNFPFDGRGTVLAHAFFPTGHKTSVEVHFDADETWNTHPDSEEGTNLFNVAAHEIGHSLGLSHSNVESALMYPWYKKMENGFDYELPDDDKQAIQFLYGSRDNRRKWAKNPEFHPVTTTTTTTTTTTPRPRPRVVYPNRPKIPYDPHYPQGRPYGPRKPQERPYVPRYPQEPTYDPRKPPERPYEPHKPDERPYDPYSPHYPQTPMNPNKKHYPKQDNDQYPYNADRRKIHHKHKTDRIPERNYPDRVHPTKVFTTKQPEKYPQHIPAGNHPKETTPKESPTIKPLPDTCDTSYDAISVIRQEVFIFKDAYFWRIDGNGLLPDYPALINRLWQGLPRNLTHVDAVYERSDGRIIFFIGNLYYRFSTNRVDSSYPKPLTHLGIPREITHIDGAMVWGHNGKTYLYSGDRYWSFDEELQHVELDYPRHISMWKGVGTDIDAVFQWKDGKTYFFKGKGFWKFNDLHMRVEEKGQKLSAPFWMGCTTNYRQNHTVVSSRTFMVSGNSTKHNTFNIFVLTIIIFIYSQLRNI